MRHLCLPVTSILALALATGPAFAQPDPEPEPAPSEEPPAPSDEAPAADTEGDDEELSDEELLEEEGLEDPKRPPPAGMGVIWGTLRDTKLDEPLIEAQVEVIGAGKTVFTDFDGNYRLELPPGTYSLRFFYELHEPKQIQGVVVKAGKIQEVDEKLAPEEGAVETFEIETEADTSSIEGQLLSRKRASVVGDAIGRAEIARTPDSNAAQAAQRIVGATIVGGRYVYVRGLGERYTNALLDGVPLPSPEPDRATVPLDLFPSKLLDSLVILKTFVPDMPGDFAGGSVRISTRQLPDELMFYVNGSVGINTQTTGSQYLQYRGSSTDWLGFDGGARQLPEAIPDYRIGSTYKNPDGSFQTRDQVAGYTNALNSYMSTLRQLAPPNHSFDVVVGNTFDLGGEQKLGVVGAFGYGRNFSRITGELFRTARSSNEAPDDVVELNRFEIERGIDTVRYGGLLGLTYQIDDNHKLHLSGLYTRRSDDEARELEGHHEERASTVHETRLQFVARDLISGQLRGEHDFPALDDAKLDWQAFASVARRNQPNTRATVYQYDSEFGYKFEDDSFSGLHFYADMDERTLGGGFNWLQPLDQDKSPVNLKLGSLVTIRDREFGARRFRFRPEGAAPACAISEFDSSCPDQLFDANGLTDRFQVEENTLAIGDSYRAGLDVYAGYVMLDAHLIENLRLIAGPRLEVSKQTVETFDPYGTNSEAVAGEIEGLDVLPALSLVWGVRDDMNLRFAASRTLARPQLREIAPFSFTNYFGGYVEIGNPDLDNTQIYNGDIRWEWFPTPSEVIAASLFTKHFVKPIEPILVASSGNGVITYQNVRGANLIGGEVEARKNFGFITEPLEDLSIIGNVTLAFSKVDIDPETPGAANLRSLQRPLTNQAPWVVNLSLDYDNQDIGFQVRALYNIIGRRIAFPSENPVPDVYFQPRHELGATVGQMLAPGLQAKLTGSNLLNDDFRLTYTKNDTEQNLHRQWRTGAQLSVSLSYTY